MEETILYPSPNWFLPSILKATADGWLVYGGPGKSLVVLEPLTPDFDGVIDSPHRHKAHVLYKGHQDRVVSVDISPEWPKKRHFVSGCSDGTVTKWNILQVDGKWSIKALLHHEIHKADREEGAGIIGVGYSTASHVISVGNPSNITVWNLNTTTTKSYTGFMRHFKATCMSCSPHKPMVVAVGTKQGVVFVLNVMSKGFLMYKVRGQDDEVSQVSWCPQYNVTMIRTPQVNKKSVATQRMEQIRNDHEPSKLETSGVDTNLPEDSFDNSAVVSEDDMFDIYQDHEKNEFGHKKYEPEDIVVKTKAGDEKDDFLAECERLKAQILKNKQEEEESIETLVEAMDNVQVDEPSHSKSSEGEAKPSTSSIASGSTHMKPVGTNRDHEHLLASICKNGSSIRIFSNTGKVVATSSLILPYMKTTSGKPLVVKQTLSASLHWYKADGLLISDGKTNLLECNPLNIDQKYRIRWGMLHSAHRRGVYYVTSNAPCQQTPAAEAAATSEPSEPPRLYAWTIGQDRYLIKYDLTARAVVAKYGTCGGFLYDIRPCPYDAGKLSIGVGDGAVRIWETQTTGEDDNKLTLGEVTTYWQNVQGKVLQCAWHPTKENLLAFATAESRVGLLDTSKGERCARVLPSALSHGVYSLGWGPGMQLFAVGGRELVMYQANRPDLVPVAVEIEIEGQTWYPCVVNYSPRGLTVASSAGGVALFTGPGGKAIAAIFVFTRTIHAIEWHPQYTSSSDQESKYKDLMAVTGVDKAYAIVILQYEDKEGGGKHFRIVHSLSGHGDKVLQAYWSPHRDGQLLSTSLDQTVRVWDAINGVCVSVFDGHAAGTLGAAWCAPPQLADKVLTGGNDFCMRLWDINCYPAEDYKGLPKEKPKKKKHMKHRQASERGPEDYDDDSDKEFDYKEQEIHKKETGKEQEIDKEKEMYYKEGEYSDEDTAAMKGRSSMGKRFVMPIVSKQATKANVQTVRLMMQKHFDKDSDMNSILKAAKEENPELYDLDFLKLFGNINEVNEVLDMECESHLELKAYREYVMLMIFRGRIDTVMQFAVENDVLDNFLLSLAPCVSYKYWKDMMYSYVAQIDRLAFRKFEDIAIVGLGSKEYMNVYRKAAALLSVHDVKGTIEILEKAKLFKEAYILCRCRHMDSIATDVLRKWSRAAGYNGNLMLSALTQVVLGDLSGAASTLRRSNKPEGLNLAVELAKLAGLNVFADYMETKVKKAVEQHPQEPQTEELLEELPTKMELLMKVNRGQIEETKIEDVNDGDHDSVNGETACASEEN